MTPLKNSRSALSRLLRHKPAAGRPQPPPPPSPVLGETAFRHYHAAPQRPGFIQSFSRRPLRHEPAALFRPPPAQAQVPPPRHYFTSSRRPEVIHFTRRRGGARWYHDRRKVAAVVLLTGGGAIVVYFGNLETVPYTNRTHFVLVSPQLERQLGESQFADLKKELAPKILPPLHPDSVRVRLIASEIVRALHRGLADCRSDDFDDASYGDISTDIAVKARDLDPEDVMHRVSPGKTAGTAARAQRDDELLDDRWVAESRRRGKARGAQPQTKHLNELNWEVIVVRDKLINAMCLPGGKIVVFTGLLDHFKTDAEIATVLSHEIGHAIARHLPEMITKGMWFTILQLIVLQFIYMPDLINAMSTLLLRLPFSRRMEVEADHIGLMLQASAGFDPRTAPKVYEKLGQIAGNQSVLKSYLSTHPSSKKRSELLSRAKVMEEAMQLYREACAGHGTEGFL
ncbi:unnamed protein product [Triticum turgidum subsp. durum]|uniref:Peptidase M48 domain-containing protein n=1 Tax=Triticum turgidum subsp. durum TaxID=4567 RepID=A0A9R0YRY3_TRITD|nr:unnamed protein product [Triticum turgidum subsp. durum]